jgi:hypothetical protein
VTEKQKGRLKEKFLIIAKDLDAKFGFQEGSEETFSSIFSMLLDSAKADFPYLPDCQLRIKEEYPKLTPEESYLRAFQLFKDEVCAWRNKWFGEVNTDE